MRKLALISALAALFAILPSLHSPTLASAVSPVTITVDADPATPGDQPSRTVFAATTFSVNINIGSVSDLEAFNLELQYDQTILLAPTVSSGPDTARNPSANVSFLSSTGRTWACSPPPPNGDINPDPTIGVAFISCFSTGSTAGPSTASESLLTAVQFDAIAAGTSTLTLLNVNTFKAGGVETGSCNPTVIVPATCTGATITVDRDSDGDGVPDSADNCPNWYNPAQNLPAWTVPAGDPDCDGFTTTVERYVGTVATLHCGVNAWPVDLNNDGKVTLADITPLVLAFNAVGPGLPWQQRFDLVADNKITLADIVNFVLLYNKTCA
jgi:hypothetical protein